MPISRIKVAHTLSCGARNPVFGRECGMILMWRLKNISLMIILSLRQLWFSRPIWYLTKGICNITVFKDLVMCDWPGNLILMVLTLSLYELKSISCVSSCDHKAYIKVWDGGVQRQCAYGERGDFLWLLLWVFCIVLDVTTAKSQ